ncbi:MAG TPA: hypothetical protein VFL42_06415 [Terriglobales bacterium]|nr:hypothetical protein [Terriglobales bacterium]
MNAPRTRREFLAEVGKGMMVASVGYEVAHNLGLANAAADEIPAALSFGSLEPLVCQLQETPVNRLLPLLVDKLQSGLSLRQLTAAAALANARTFGGEDYVGFHTMMALAPALHMAGELPTEQQPLPVLKVLYRNTNRIQEHGGRNGEVLQAVQPPDASKTGASAESLRELVRAKDVQRAELTFAELAQRSNQEAFDDLLMTVQDHTEVHRVVLPYRAWDLLGLIGKEQAHTLLRQSVRYCIKAESWPRNDTYDQPRALLPKILEEHKLLDRNAGTREAEDAWVEQMSTTIFKSTPEQAAEAAAAALAEGMSPAALGEAITLAANQLVLRDMGRTPSAEVAGKPIGSVHGDSIGVHACDSANAWRNLSMASNSRNCFASLILGAYQVALDRINRGGDFLNWQPLPLARHLDEVKSTEPDALLREAEEAIRGNLQAKASAVVARYGSLGHSPRPVFDLMLRYAISEDGALHAEKFYRTVSEEFASTRPAFRWRHLVALARVTASEYGRPAAGITEARTLLKV